MAIYGFARLVDYLGDEYAGDRLDALDWMARQTDLALADPERPELHALIAAAARTVRVARRRPWRPRRADRRQPPGSGGPRPTPPSTPGGYCRLSANPVGRLVLAAFGAATPERRRWSDAICTGLQLAEHWQDVAEDAAAGRIYLPADDMARFGVGARRAERRPARIARPCGA